MGCKGCAERRVWLKSRARNVKDSVVASSRVTAALSTATRDKLLAKLNNRPGPPVV